MKFGRTYELEIQVTNDAEQKILTSANAGTFVSETAVIIKYPVTIDIDIVKNVQAEANNAVIRIYNLGEDTRRKLFKFPLDPDNLTGYRWVILRAGYDSPRFAFLDGKKVPVQPPILPTIFRGALRQASSQRHGTDMITTIMAFDGALAMSNGQVGFTLPAGWTMNDVLVKIAKALPGIATGKISDFQMDNSRGITVSGNAWEAAKSLVYDRDGHAFIDAETVNFLKKNDYIQSDTFELTSDTGLLGTPCVVSQFQYDVTMLFEPRVKIGTIINLKSQESMFNGLYIVKGISHRGRISEASSAPMITTLNLWPGKDNKGNATLEAVA